jgi:Mg/Co/Ni transporter MgtE
MTATHIGHTVVRVSQATRRRIVWLIGAIVTAWMTATIVAVMAVTIGTVAAADATTITVIGTAVMAAVLYGHFSRMGRVDEPLVIGLLICWAVTLGLLSL